MTMMIMMMMVMMMMMLTFPWFGQLKLIVAIEQLRNYSIRNEQITHLHLS